MGKHNTVESLSRMLQVVKLLGSEDGATVTQISDKTEIDRWTVKNMIDSLGNSDNDGMGFCVEEYRNPCDNRQTYYKIARENLWTLTLPSLNLTDEEGMLLALLIEQSKQTPVLKTVAEGLQSKINWLNDVSDYMIFNVSSLEKIIGADTREAVRITLNSIQKNLCLEFNYNNARDSKNGVRKVMPLYVFIYDGGLYLNAQKLEDGQLRTYAFERMRGLPHLLDIRKEELPEKLEYDGRLEDPFGPFRDCDKPFEVEVKFDSWQGWYTMQKRWPDSVSISRNEDGTVIMRAQTSCFDGCRRWVLSQGNQIEVLKPEWLRKSVIEKLNEAIEVYYH